MGVVRKVDFHLTNGWIHKKKWVENLFSKDAGSKGICLDGCYVVRCDLCDSAIGL